MACTLRELTRTASEGLGYDDTLLCHDGSDTPANKKAWSLGNIKFKRVLLRAQLSSTDVRMLIHLGKHYLAQLQGEEETGDFDIKVVLEGDANAA